MKETKPIPRDRYDQSKQSLSLSNAPHSWGDLIGAVHTPSIKALTLSNHSSNQGGNQLTDSHISFLASTEWPNLTLLWLSTCAFTQTVTRSPKPESQR